MKFLIRLTFLFWFVFILTGCSNSPKATTETRHREVINLNTNLIDAEVHNNIGKGTILIELSSNENLYSDVTLNTQLLKLSNNNLIEVMNITNTITSEELGNGETLSFRVPLDNLSLGQYEIKSHALTIEKDPYGSKYGELITTYFTVMSDEILLNWIEYPSPSSEAVKTGD